MNFREIKKFFWAERSAEIATRIGPTNVETAAQGMMDEASSLIESMRLDTLKSLNILYTPPENLYNDIAELAAKISDMPTSFVVLVDKDVIFIKATFNGFLSAGYNVPRNKTFCDYTIQNSDSPYVISNVFENRLFTDYEWVLNGDVGFYAGFPLLKDGYAVGTLCVTDTKPRMMSEETIENLKTLARVTIETIAKK